MSSDTPLSPNPQTLLVSARTQAALLAGVDYAGLAAGWAEALADFAARARTVRLYGGYSLSQKY